MRLRREKTLTVEDVEPASAMVLLAVPLGLAAVVTALLTNGVIHVVALGASTLVLVYIAVIGSRLSRGRRGTPKQPH